MNSAILEFIYDWLQESQPNIICTKYKCFPQSVIFDTYLDLRVNIGFNVPESLISRYLGVRGSSISFNAINYDLNDPQTLANVQAAIVQWANEIYVRISQESYP